LNFIRIRPTVAETGTVKLSDTHAKVYVAEKFKKIRQN